MARSSREPEREGRSFRDQKRTKEDVKTRANMRGGNFDSYVKSDFKFYKVRDGKNLVRILPPSWDGAKHYGYDIWVNYGIGVDNQSYLSLKKMKGEADPLDEARREAEREGDKDLVRALQPRQRVLVWLIDRLDEGEGPQLWPIPFSVDKDFANLSIDEDTGEVLFIDDRKTGCDVRFYKEGQGLKTKYPSSKMKLLKSSTLSEDSATARDWLDFITENPVPDCLQYYTYDQISTAFDGQARIDRDDDDEDRPRGRRGPAARPRADDDDEDEQEAKPKRGGKPADDDADDDDDKADEKPKRQHTRAKADDDDDTADDDDAPKKPRQRAKADDDDDEPDDSDTIRSRLSRRRNAGKTSKRDDDDDDAEDE